MAKVWADFHDRILPDVPSCPVGQVNLMLREAVIEFYERSGVLVAALDPIPVLDATATYDLTPPIGYSVVRIEELMMGDLRLLPIDLARLSQMYINWQSIEGPPQYYTCETIDTLRLVPTPDQDYTDTLVPRVVLAPTRSSAGIDEDWVFEQWVDELSAGAMARLMRMQQKPWTDLQRSVAFEGDFRRGWMSAKAQKDRGFSGAVQQVRLKRIF